MPELPEVEITARGVGQHVLGHLLERTTVLERRLRWPVPDAVNLCNGWTLDSVTRRSKYLVMQFGQQALVVHLGMSGSLKVVDPAAPLEKHDHIEWLFRAADGRHCALRYNDPRRFGSVEHVAVTAGWEARFQRFSALGPEPFSADFTPQGLFKATRGKRVSIKALLLAGHAVVGVGNIYACEALFRSAIRPGRAAGRLSRADCVRLHQAVVAVLGEAIERGGSTLRNFSAVNGELGHFQTHCDVYGREGEPCKRCGATVKRRVMNQRSTFYCPGCQA
ncbi:bifunctional DNA-formamidopyrimidine glycosylase/DNA-(apurinic or apyrimidinic site) lyase [Limnobacter humi]|uniref:Formamidopyrimidine-DNA glycosylase n=1 Tax=Limnobacter humi TaxID=1778671 RepID=A0ABT1WIU6_9BURK|nr:bifunctional DNA-formamidopyrimidine glycosylase/DNA-(apurinic or apyrimidinic site) lyase [Limnobacter humi]MCQ8897432.1 bifunctional DNA-formamidopyrimidine glycosylase/DNA-(apurinic or apyrimidinic site) lyase [Limnobacter humi]